jgi:hypothetical protein
MQAVKQHRSERLFWLNFAHPPEEKAHMELETRQWL